MLIGWDLHHIKITYTSDYFEQLYNYAIQLINMNLAYVDKSNINDIREMRQNGIESIYRNNTIETNLIEFDKMKNGVYKENEAVLRLKIDMQNNNHSLRDPIAYRIINGEHYKTKNVWKIYPTYDYSHGIVDSLEEITYSYCSIEFYVRRELYYWPLEKLGLKCAIVKEFGRLNVENNFYQKEKY